MKLPCRLCFLVLAISCLSRGQNAATSPKVDQGAQRTASPDTRTISTPQNETKDETTNQMTSNQPSQTPTAITLTTEETYTTEASGEPSEDTTENNTSDDGLKNTTRPDDDKTQISTSAPSIPGTTKEPEQKKSRFLYVILVLIALLIIILCVILYFLRRVNRSYSFDLQRPVGNYQNEPVGVFEPVYLDDLDRPVSKDTVITEDLSNSPVANGTNLQSEEKVSNEENAAQEQPDANGLQNSPTSNTSSSSTGAEPEKISEPLSMTDLFFDAVGEEQNENNNNPSVCPSGPFVEINLDEPVWCNQLLTSPQASSSVLPFSHFSFSSSS
ncbi:uncharacterized protein LOC121639783 [Melanotaenia boesemani]|uniref:uncharacterized protein LOC121639783 n=1 Tax=Melanotaenia boesemani TaxID=1250792 RepID=UPI001C03C8E9|nr:uncharacterized protein LOC121639783 [Melanotaenia boesemani]